jgi:hypothetical protein
MIEPLSYLARVAHIAGAVILIGGLFRANGMALTIGVVAATFASGLYNLSLKMAAGVPKEYHMIFGLKFLLVMHVAAVAILVAKQGTPEEKIARMRKGVVISGLVVIALSAALRGLGQ